MHGKLDKIKKDRYCFKEDILSRFVDGDLPENIKFSVTEHIRGCNECNSKVLMLIQTDKILNNIKPVRESENFDLDFYNKLNNAIDKFSIKTIIVGFYRKFIRDLSILFSPRMSVLLKSIVTVVFILAVLFTGVYYSGSDMPFINLVEGEGYIYDNKTETWGKVDTNALLKKGDIIKTGESSQLEVILPSKYHVRVKEKSVLRIAGLSPKHRSGTALLDVENGVVMVDIDKGFSGSKFRVRTKMATVQALGTKFMVSVEGTSNKNWIGVLEGTVDVRSSRRFINNKEFRRIVLLNAGMKTEIAPDMPLSEPLPLIMDEWQQISELFMIGHKTRVALLISVFKGRVYELLAPCPIYISDNNPRVIPVQLEEAVEEITEAVKTDNYYFHLSGIRKLEEIVAANPSSEYNVKLLLFIGAYYCYLDMYPQAIDIFESISNDYPENILVSLAECAKAVIYSDFLNDAASAKKLYEYILEKYPKSPEAKLAREKLSKI